jgi:hypothetical protein
MQAAHKSKEQSEKLVEAVKSLDCRPKALGMLESRHWVLDTRLERVNVKHRQTPDARPQILSVNTGGRCKSFGGS